MSKYQIKYLMSPVSDKRFRNNLLYNKDNINKTYLENSLFGSVSENLSYAPVNKPAEDNSSQYKLKEGDSLNINDVQITVTDPYGIRNFEGREGKHSTGIDYKTSNGQAISLTDGVVESVSLDGDGSVIKPTEGSAGGYYVVIRNNDGTKSQYMHLNPMTKDEMDGLIGKELKRGDAIWGYDEGSGSMTGPHVKYRVFTGSSASKSHIDPTKYILGKF
jgi:murein DD-endopeptidase MepM/ murein hydrolase activator NlpD